MDCICIKDLQVHANHGVLPEENALGQRFVISATLFVDLRRAGESDAIADSVNYADVCHLIDRYTRENTFDLLERLAQGLCDEILAVHPLVERVRLEVKKPVGADRPSVGLCFSMHGALSLVWGVSFWRSVLRATSRPFSRR